MTTKRASLPGADELFRNTAAPATRPEEQQQATPPQAQPVAPVTPMPQPPVSSTPAPQAPAPISAPIPAPAPARPVRAASPPKLQTPRTGSGRTKHEEKVTFYCTREELLALERARLALKEHGVSIDRGRIVREALSYTLAEFEASGAASILVDRLSRHY